MAGQWDKIFKQQGKFFTKVQGDISRIVKLFKRRNVKRVLDLGCGSGRHTVYLAKHGFEVYGIDISRTGIKMTRKFLLKEKLKGNLKIGSIYKKLPYKDNFFDAVISVQVLHHARIESIRKVIREIERVLKLKGLFFTTNRRRRIQRNVKILTEEYENLREKFRYRIIAPMTYVPTGGAEKGLIHYLFNKKSFRKEFRHFKIYDIWVESNKRHYCLLGELKSK
ncbi:MAG: hypothetical protein A2Z68_01275 [Candidatus Nealsonbacteria bacterium RBG_13_38_11]|uniref:Methyltransferase type 11 domain-containing protein n=1 Tax=Candidatus Nealsonbacteria bacterium RBG_13_38_11 TaxID=1801662 RepID=A0A1G2E0N7_9BACT|nr:MAG: hypothetical protein A2Z68_01275 [Candidatus Nealsonbacteria bacterium RBG_13_38_11]